VLVVEIGQCVVMLLEVKQERFSDKRDKDPKLCVIFQETQVIGRGDGQERRQYFLSTVWLRYFVAVVGIHYLNLAH